MPYRVLFRENAPGRLATPPSRGDCPAMSNSVHKSVRRVGIVGTSSPRCRESRYCMGLGRLRPPTSRLSGPYQIGQIPAKCRDFTGRTHDLPYFSGKHSGIFRDLRAQEPAQTIRASSKPISQRTRAVHPISRPQPWFRGQQPTATFRPPS